LVACWLVHSPESKDKAWGTKSSADSGAGVEFFLSVYSVWCGVGVLVPVCELGTAAV
jgi:hypothetical protein